MALEFTTSYLDDSRALFRYYKKLAEGAMEQVTDEQLFAALDPEMNSIAAIVKHMAGNMRSRWTDFLISDGEKPDRNRESEFVVPTASRDEVMRPWERGWNALSALWNRSRTPTWRGRSISAARPLGDSGHQPAGGALRLSLRPDRAAGEAFPRGRWRSLTIPRNRSAEFNSRVGAGEASQR